MEERKIAEAQIESFCQYLIPVNFFIPHQKKLSLKPTAKPCTRRSPRRIKAASRKKPKRKAAK